MVMGEERQREKQMGCMAGFFQMFDRHQIQILSGKRLHSAKRLPPPTGLLESTPDKSQSQSTKSTTTTTPTPPSPSPEQPPSTPTPAAAKSPLPFPVFETPPRSHSPWKFSKEAPRLSLDSRATTDAKGFLYPREIRTNPTPHYQQQQQPEPDDDSDKQRRSPSVVARLMGLDQLPHHHSNPDAPQVQNAQLRRSASESRVNKDIYRFVEPATAFAKHGSLKQFNTNAQSNNRIGYENANVNSNANVKLNVTFYSRNAMAGKESSSSVKTNQRTGIGSGLGLIQRKSFYDTTDFFPEPKQSVTTDDKIKRRLRMRGIDEPSKDLETWKCILEAVQLEGLLHSSKPGPRPEFCQTNFVRDHDGFDESPIVVMKPARLSSSNSVSRNKSGNYSPPSSYRMRSLATAPSRRVPSSVNGDFIPRHENAVRSHSRAKSSVSPTRSESIVKSPSRTRTVNMEAQRRANDVSERRVSPVQSPRVGSRRLEPTMSRSPRTRRMENHREEEELEEEKVFLTAEDQRSVVSESSFSSASQTDTERFKIEGYKEGRNLLERCDKLLHSIAEITSSTPELQPSPVSVLDSSFYKEELSPSPIMKRTIAFNDQPAESDDDAWSSAVSPISMKLEENSDDGDFVYISDVLRASSYLPEDSDVFLLLEKQQYLKGKDTSKVSRLKRKLIFDITTEILDRKQNLPKWKNGSLTNATFERPPLQQIWAEFQKIRERSASDDLFEVICGVLRKDLAGDAVYGWKDCPVEISEAVLYLERLLFRDLISETIQDLAAISGNCNKVQLPRRKLVF